MPGPPEYVSQQELAGSGAGGIAVPEIHNTVGAAAARMFGAAGEMAGALHAASVATTRANAETDYLVGLDKLRQQYTQDPDWQTAAQRFAADHDALMTGSLERLAGDPEAQARMRERLVRAFLPAQNAVQRAALGGMVRGANSAADVQQAAVRRVASGAGTAIERADAIDAFHNSLADLVRPGILPSAAAQARVKALDMDIATDDARGVIAANPDAAAVAIDEPGTFPGIDIARRVTLAQEAQQAIAARDAAIAPATMYAGGLALARAGKLDESWLMDHEPLLTATGYGRLAAMLPGRASDPAARNPETYAALLDRAFAGDEVAVHAAPDEFLHGSIDRDALNHVLDTADAVARDAKARPWANDQRRDLADQLAPTEAQDARQAWQQISAMRDYEAWLSGSPEATPDEGAAQVRAIADRARDRSAADARASLPMPRFMAAPRAKIDAKAIEEAAGRLREAFAAGHLDGEDLADEVELMQAWRDAVGRGGR